MSGPAAPGPDRLVEVLERARSVGFLGPGPVADHVEHAARFRDALRSGGLLGAETGPGRPGAARLVERRIVERRMVERRTAVGRIADIGSGGGVPGLAILIAEPGLRAVLIDAAQKRCSFLVWAAAELGLSDRVEVWCGRAEVLGHEERARERFDAVVARGFGPPATTLECATGLVRPGGRVIVSEPPERRQWPADALRELSLVEIENPGGHGPVDGVVVFERLANLSPAVPRNGKQLQRRPRFVME